MGERPQLTIVIDPLLPKDGGGFRRNRLPRRPLRVVDPIEARLHNLRAAIRF